MYPQNNFIYQQDGAPSHTSKASQQFLKNATPEFIKKDEWPPQSPDVNPMDYSIWDSLTEKVYKGRSDKFDVEQLKERILEAWRENLL